jgi:hypothetical protein
MPVKIRNAVIILLLVLIAVLTGLIVYLDQLASRNRAPAGQAEQPAGRPNLRPVPNQDQFTKYEYALPRAPNTDPGQSVYSPVAQLRGRIAAFSPETVTLTVAGQPHELALPDQLRLFCVPEIHTDKKGRSVPGREIYFDMKSETVGQVTPRSRVTALFAPGREIGAVVDVTPEDRMTAKLIISYDCNPN